MSYLWITKRIVSPLHNYKCIGLLKELSEKITNDNIYGLIDHNSDGNREFVFTNNGDAPLLIKSVKASCGCTVPQYPKEEIAAGKSGEIKVKYATNRVGKFTKTITVATNADKKPIILTIKGEVKPAKQDNAVPVKDTQGSPLEKK